MVVSGHLVNKPTCGWLAVAGMFCNKEYEHFCGYCTVTACSIFVDKYFVGFLLLQYRSMQFETTYTEHDKMAALSYLEYLLQIERNPTAFSGRRVLAAVLMKSPDSSITVLSLGTGKNLPYV